MLIIGKLTALKVAREQRPGMHSDGGGLYLCVARGGTKSWIFRFWVPERDATTGELVIDPTTKKRSGRVREMGLGSCITVSLAEARERALECRKLREKEIDPIDAREAAKRQAALERVKALKFKDAAAAYIAAHRVAWKNHKHAAQWPATLARYAYPIIGELPLHLIDTTLVMKVIEPIWSEKPETANRLRGRIETVLDWATVRGYRHGENPARWRGHLDKLLPARSKVRKTQHHSALPYAELPAFLVKLREQDGVAARALEFTILTAARTGETIGAKRGEIDTKNKLWTIPAERMKAGKDHRVPLSDRALAIVEAIGAAAILRLKLCACVFKRSITCSVVRSATLKARCAAISTDIRSAVSRSLRTVAWISISDSTPTSRSTRERLSMLASVAIRSPRKESS